MDNTILSYERELAQIGIVSVILLVLSRGSRRGLGGLMSRIRRIGRRRALCVLGSGVLGFSTSALLTATCGVPVPSIHDEFCYLLAADTFAHGRLSNPSPPSPDHFEAVHINLTPTYHSMYPPAQGLFLALGQVIGGHAVLGLWLSMGLACAALCWMLQAFVPPQWAVLGSLIGLSRFSLMRYPASWILQVGYWSHSYWGGAVALLGGALVLGAMRRLIRTPRLRDTTLLGMGLTILANSRPLEGLVASIPVALVILAAFHRHAGEQPRTAAACGLLLGGILLAAALGMGYYNLRTTGDPLMRPYELNAQRYATTPTTLFQSVTPRSDFVHEHIGRYHSQWAQSEFERQQTWNGYLWELKNKFFSFWYFYFGVLLSIPFVVLPWAMRSSWTTFAILTCALVFLALAAVPWFQPHYLAPIAPLFLIIELTCLRVLWTMPGFLSPFSRALAAAVPLSLLIVMPAYAVDWSQLPTQPRWHHERQRLLSRLSTEGGEHLIVVRYSPSHSPHEEWVYNGADLDASVIWIHDLGIVRNRALLEHYRGRQVWLLTWNGGSVNLQRYPLEATFPNT